MGHKDYPRIRHIHAQGTEVFLIIGARKVYVCPIGGLFGKTGWIPFRALTKFEILKFWHRIMPLPSDRLTCEIFLWSYSLSDAGMEKEKHQQQSSTTKKH